MPLKFIPHTVNKTFIGHKAVIIDEDKLVRWVASTLMAKHNHILKIISSGTDGSVTNAKDTVIQNIIKNILHAANDFHRDELHIPLLYWWYTFTPLCRYTFTPPLTPSTLTKKYTPHSIYWSGSWQEPEPNRARPLK